MIPLNVLLVSIFAALSIGAFGGWHFTSEHYDAQQLKIERQHQADYRAAVERGNQASARLLTAENQIREITKWKGKQIETVTADRPCLSGAALGLLNATTVPRISAHPGQPLAASSAAPPAADPGATDADVVRWGIEAAEQYEICAARLTELQGFFR